MTFNLSEKIWQEYPKNDYSEGEVIWRDDVKEFIQLLKESLITDDISLYDYRKETHTNAELQKAVEEQIGRIMKDIDKLCGDKLK
jgi:hypothetical protein